jgi:hypothetical protein
MRDPELLKRLRHHARRRVTLVSDLGSLKDFTNNPETISLGSFRFIEKENTPESAAPREQGGWTFHSSNQSTPDSTLGYFHNANNRLTTNVNIELDNSYPAELLKKLQEFKQAPNYDEYTEVIVDDGASAITGIPATPITPATPGSPLGENSDLHNWRYYFVDHFNRIFLDQTDFKANLNDSIRKENASRSEVRYRQWMALVTSEDSHYYKVSTDGKKQSLGRKIAQQIIWDYQTGLCSFYNCVLGLTESINSLIAHVVKDIDIENSFSMADCSSLLSALQKKSTCALFLELIGSLNPSFGLQGCLTSSAKKSSKLLLAVSLWASLSRS